MLLLTLNLLGILPDDYPTRCDCGWYYYTNYNKTQLRCSNLNCPIIDSSKLPYALDTLHIKASMGVDTAKIFVHALQLDHIMKFFKLTEEDAIRLPNKVQSSFRKFLSGMQQLRQEGVRLTTFITAWSFSNLGGNSCNDIFSTFSTPMEFYSKFNSAYDMSVYVAEAIKQQVDTDTVQGIVKTLLQNKKIILEIAEAFRFTAVSGTIVKFSITGDIIKLTWEDGSGISPRETLETFINEHFNVNSSFFKTFSYKKQDFLIRDTNIMSRKLEAAKDKLIDSIDLAYYLLQSYGYNTSNFYFRVKSTSYFPESLCGTLDLEDHEISILGEFETWEQLKEAYKNNFSIEIFNTLEENVNLSLLSNYQGIKDYFGEELKTNAPEEQNKTLKVSNWATLQYLFKVRYQLKLYLVTSVKFPLINATYFTVDTNEYFNEDTPVNLQQIFSESACIKTLADLLNLFNVEEE